MKLKIILIFLVSNFALGQEQLYVEVIYNKAYKNYKDKTNNAPKLLKNQEYKLICDNREALFNYEENMNSDLETNRRFISKGGGGGIYYCNLMENKELKQVKRADNTYLIESKVSDRKWELTNETKYIDQYLCYKAITVNSYVSLFSEEEVKAIITVWYTPEIPLSYGPTGYNGLPGLILEKSSASFYYIATKISISKKSNKEIKKPILGTIISTKDYEEMLRNRLEEMKEN